MKQEDPETVIPPSITRLRHYSKSTIRPATWFDKPISPKRDRELRSGRRWMRQRSQTMLGDPKKAIRSMAVPLNSPISSSRSTSRGHLVVFRTRSDASSAVSTISPVYWIISGLVTGIGVGASTAIARCLGRDERSKAESLATQTVVLSIIISAIFTPILFILIDPVVVGVGAEDVIGLCEAYIYPIVLLTVFVILEGTVSESSDPRERAKKFHGQLCLSATVKWSWTPSSSTVRDSPRRCRLANGMATVFSSALGLYWYLSGRGYIRMSFRGSGSSAGRLGTSCMWGYHVQRNPY